MIKRLRVKNYKSLADADLELPRLAIFIGPNNSGKSNLFDALRVISTVAQGGLRPITDFENPLARKWSILTKEALWSNAQEPVMEFGVESVYKDKELGYELSLSVTNTSSYFVEERVTLPARDDILVRNRKGQVMSVDRSLGTLSIDEWERKPHRRLAILPANESVLSLLRREDYKPYYDGNIKHLAQILFLFLDPDAIRRSSIVTDKPVLGPDGSNLPTVLDNLLSLHTDTFNSMVKSISRSINELERIVLLPYSEGSKQVAVQEKGIVKPIPAPLISDGLLRLLVFYALAYSPSSPGIIAIEEPEDGINPRLLRVLLELFRDMAGSGTHQILITSHSKLLMDMARKEEVITVQKEEGATRFVPLAEHPHIDEFLEDLSIGTLHYSGEV